ncbi:hypothetical protein [Paraburkholderia sp. SG-MS1]|uniref:hypothetical protein n=1 Tax=Paraburkholderia sp. SG-MS1 TaxID=2023741 RepID=UPI001445F1A3|nr:hypothetical protein [Paraburkholderia sp. SG-MS1]
MEEHVVAWQRATVTQHALLPVRVSHDAFFHVRYGGPKDGAVENAFIAHTYASVRTLLAKANSATPIVYFCSKAVGRDMSVRRVTAVREVPDTNMYILDFEDGRGVLWDESEYLGSISAYVEIDTPLTVSQLGNISVRIASVTNAEQGLNDAAQDRV